MSLVVNTNISSLNARRFMNMNTTGLDTTFQRLSSGFRINSASDDAAGLQISNRLTGQIDGLNQGIRNANDGISMAQVAEGALAEMTNALQRMRVLAVQAGNGINTPTDKAALQEEVRALQKEIDRIAETTNFAGQNLLDGSLKTSFLVGANANQNIDLDLAQFGALDTEDLWISEIDVTKPKSQSDGWRNHIGPEYDAEGKPRFYSANSAFSGYYYGPLGSGPSYGAPNKTISGISVSVNGDDWLTIPSYHTATGSREDFVNAFNSALGSNLLVFDPAPLPAVPPSGTVRVVQDVTIQFRYVGAGVSEDSAVAMDKLDVLTDYTGIGLSELGRFDELSLPIGGLPVGNVDDHTSIIDRAIEKVDSVRAYLGATQNRLQSTTNNAANISENLQAARSRIRDADYAVETAELTKRQILNQASSTVLAQANQRPSLALSLLSG